MTQKRPIKIIFTGPESSGKTTLAKLAAKAYNTAWHPEYSRSYLTNLNRPYEAKDLVNIAEGQLKSEQQFLKLNIQKSPLFLDTSFLVIKIWSIYKYGFYNFKIEKLLYQNLPILFFLCDWQIPWEADSLREHPHERGQLYTLYKKELSQLKVPFFELKGTLEDRLKLMEKILNNFC